MGDEKTKGFTTVICDLFHMLLTWETMWRGSSFSAMEKFGIFLFIHSSEFDSQCQCLIRVDDPHVLPLQSTSLASPIPRHGQLSSPYLLQRHATTMPSISSSERNAKRTASMLLGAVTIRNLLHVVA